MHVVRLVQHTNKAVPKHRPSGVVVPWHTVLYTVTYTEDDAYSLLKSVKSITTSYFSPVLGTLQKSVVV